MKWNQINYDLEESQIKFIQVNFLQFTPVVGQHLIIAQVNEHGEQVVVLAVVDVPLLPGHVHV